MQSGAERREFQRLRLDPPVAGTLCDAGITLIEIGVLGARVEHDEPLDASGGELRFEYNGDEVALRCEVVRTATVKAGGRSQSGVRFVAAVGESGDRLRAMLAQLVSKALEDLRSQTLAGIDHIDGDKTVRGADAGFLSYQLDASGWHRRRIFLPEQPASGFTVARNEDSEEMQRLCRVYQASDEEGQRLIRMFAELSVSASLDIPPRA
jgi:hypothetical protein